MSSSIMTNSSAMTALKTLQQTNKSLEMTQNRISTGYRVAEASDNAAYWSIATTMRSDNKALSTVQDALGLGAATVDTAYTAMDSTKDYLDEIKTKLVAAKQPGVDKAKIQSEIDQLQEQVKGIADAASFSGSNFLSINSDTGDTTQKVVASFSRDSSGALSIGTIDFDTTTSALFDAGAGQGLLEGGTAAQITSGAFAYDAGTGTPMTDGGKFTVSISVDGGTAQDIDVTVADAGDFTLDDVVNGLNSGGLTGATASKSEDGSKLVLTSTSTGSTASVEVTGVTATTNGGTAGDSDASLGFTTVASAAGSDTGGGLLAIDITDADSAQLDSYINQVDDMSDKVTTAAADLGAVKSRIGLQTDFVSNLMDAIDRGVGTLVDADMNEESTKLKALQTQQQLGIQALSIANSNSQSILSLFR